MRLDGRADTTRIRTRDTSSRSVMDLLGAAADGAVRGSLAAAAGLTLTVAVGLLLWAITPSTGSGAEPLVRGAGAAFVLAHFGTIQIGTSVGGSATLTVPPLLLTALFALVLAASAGRGRLVGAGARAEAAWIAAAATGYGAVVTTATLLLAPIGARDLRVIAWATLFALLALTAGMLWRGEALREAAVAAVPGWGIAAARAAIAAVGVVIGGAALVTAVALAVSFSTAAELTDSVTHGVGDGVGLTLAGLAYLPNAVLAATGYVTGVGFEIGAGSFSPFGSVLADLPAFPLFAAVPSSAGSSPIGIALLAVPVLGGLAAALVVMRHVEDLPDRLLAAAGASAASGSVLAIAVSLGAGGVVGGGWATIGAVGWQVGLVLAGAVLLVTATWVLAAGYRPALLQGGAGNRPGDAGEHASEDESADDPADVDAADLDAADLDAADLDAADLDAADPDSADVEPEDLEPADFDGDTDSDVDDLADADDTSADTGADLDAGTDRDAGTGSDTEPDAADTNPTDPDHPSASDVNPTVSTARPRS